MAKRKTLVGVLFLMFIGLLINNMASVRAVRVIDQAGYAVDDVRLIRAWQVSGELKRARQDESDPTLRIRVCKLRKGEIPEFIQLSSPEDRQGTRSRVEDRKICSTRV